MHLTHRSFITSAFLITAGTAQPSKLWKSSAKRRSGVVQPFPNSH